MKKNNLMKAIARSAGITEIQAEKALDAYFRLIRKRLEEGGRVIVSDFGTFTVNGTFIVKGKKVAKSRVFVCFRAAKELLEFLRLNLYG